MMTNVIISFQHLRMDKIKTLFIKQKASTLFLIKIVIMRIIFSGLLTVVTLISSAQDYTLNDFYNKNASLDSIVDSHFDKMNDTIRVGQMIVPSVGRLGKSRSHVIDLATKGYMGGVILLNGTVEEFKNDVRVFDSIAKANGYLPPIYSADAEPTLVNRKISGSKTVPKTNEIHTLQMVESVTNTISHDLNEIGITQNFAPVIDASPNKVVSNRSFGLNMDTVISFSNLFIEQTQNNNIIATAKHFPGHGFVTGDTHKKLIYIDGPMREVENYIPVIESGVLSIMVAHLAIKNNVAYNTYDRPSTCSRNIVTDLLKDSLGFRGLIITDAMNMGGVVNLENCGLLAAQAGCDQLLMPVDEEKDIMDILEAIALDSSFKEQVFESVKKIIRLKVCLGKI
jgi:beta-N-acetylhexosaminidase